MKKRLIAFGAALCMVFTPAATITGTNVWAAEAEMTEGAGKAASENPAPIKAPASTKPVVKNGLVKEAGGYVYYKNGKILKNAWKKVHRAKYYFGKNGYAYTGARRLNGKVYVFDSTGKLRRPSKATVMKSGKYTYYVMPNGQAKTGWFMVGSKLYRADIKGRLSVSRTYKGISFNKKGYAKSNLNSKLKKEVMRTVSRITTPDMSKYQKLYACWRYLTSGNFYYGGYDPDFSDKDWYKEEAYDMLMSGGGNCYGFACTFAALAKEVGFDPYVVAGRVSGTRDGAADGLTRHGWVMIDGCYYDPEGQYAGWFKGVYGEGSYNIAHTVQRYTRFTY